MENIEEQLENINEQVVLSLNEKINNKIPIISSIISLYERPKGIEHEETELEKLSSYGSEDNDMYGFEEYLIQPPFTPDSCVTEIRSKNEIKIPTFLISIEKKINNYESKLLNFYNQFQNQSVSELENSKIIIRIESYDGIKKTEYEIKNENLVLTRELEPDGKKFLPYFN